MRVVLQRVKQASVTVEDVVISKIDVGFLIFLGIETEDTNEDITWLTNKIVNMRIFDDENGHMNNAINSVNGDILVVSQFTLLGSTKKRQSTIFYKSSKTRNCYTIIQSIHFSTRK